MKANFAKEWRRLRADPRYQPAAMDIVGDAMAAALDPDAGPCGWVIARRTSPQDGVVYWTGEGWTLEVPKAVVFARKRDGEALKFVHDLYTWVVELPGYGGNFEGAAIGLPPSTGTDDTADELTEVEKWNMAGRFSSTNKRSSQ